jgi:excisionase family DNA binding protein
MATEELIDEQPYNLKEAAALLRIPGSALRILCKNKEIGFTRVNYRTFLFSKKDIADFLAQRRSEVAEEKARSVREM